MKNRKLKVRCRVCGGRRYWIRYTFNPKGELICSDCGCFTREEAESLPEAELLDV